MRLYAALLCCLPWAIPSALSGERLSDALSPVSRAQVNGTWEGTGFDPGNPRNGTVIARTGPMEVRLAIPPHYTDPPRRVRIFLVVPVTIVGLQSAESFEVSWVSGGVFQSGQVRSGQRALLFEGLVQQPVLSDTVDFSIRADAARMAGAIEYETIFEIEAN
jgi:hypothetical protein